MHAFWYPPLRLQQHDVAPDSKPRWSIPEPQPGVLLVWSRGAPRYKARAFGSSAELTVGRNAQCDLEVPDQAVSSIQLTVRHTPAGFTITITGRNPATVDGEHRITTDSELTLPHDGAPPRHVLRFGESIVLLERDLSRLSADTRTEIFVPVPVGPPRVASHAVLQAWRRAVADLWLTRAADREAAPVSVVARGNALPPRMDLPGSSN